MKIRFYNGRILAMDGDMEVRRGEVWVQGNRIVYVGEDGVQEGGKAGSQAVLRGEMSWDREIDLDGNLIMPGFANAHTHSAMTFSGPMRMTCLCRSGWRSRCFQWRQS